MKICIIGCGLRTPLLIHGLAYSGLGGMELALYDEAAGRAEMMAVLGRAIDTESKLKLAPATNLEEAIQDCSFVISSIRPGGMQERSRDEQTSVACGFAGQETTGPGGFALALRTVPVAIEHARLVERLAPDAWIVNFTNPAGLITQALSTHSGARVIGICDTPEELFFRISLALRVPLKWTECDYFGLNHLGWVDRIYVNRPGQVREDVTKRVMDDDFLLRSLYPSPLFSPEMIRGLGLIPTEYLYFYYSHCTALENQKRAGVTRAGELMILNEAVLTAIAVSLRDGLPQDALAGYRSYLNRRNASYMRLEGEGKSAFHEPDVDWDPFAAATGYHRIAVEAIRALCASEPARMVLNIRNSLAIKELEVEDVVEVPCLIDRTGPQAIGSRSLPDSARALTLAVKTYERHTIRAAVSRSRQEAQVALFLNPIVADWEVHGTASSN